VDGKERKRPSGCLISDPGRMPAPGGSAWDREPLTDLIQRSFSGQREIDIEDYFGWQHLWEGS
jgi:hypothetical protein